ncbi:ribonuclease P protein component [uncultured Croceitalea sp.]|uniref:ribonuclease P protein component n=1 Tax=uncultured Croceitalea sp. TaxID=1798908 RepID=UPI0033068DB2
MDKTARLKKFAFPKKEKLKSKKLIEQLFAEGKSITVFPLKLIYLPIVFDDDVQFKTMVVAPKKNFKSAVKRNRVKRLLREAYRLNKPYIFNNIEGNFALAILYIGKEMPDYHLVELKTKGLLEQFVKKYNHE